ncbi:MULTISPECIES: DUF2232 domain-containing protein [Thiomicrorhabdus]|uniref:DUF2232 domain-containing protein n=1 Tax=Thiomicrorhabdus heinhorstiae TaxID=2748010 RepID=A0ABS0BSX1_9GAMM|nr:MULTISPECIES: DUF2232 domain-containing protein [Thiomicrorhabdus]MBF6056899.1 DUF2232 domain-containing protein [Thiomicrorhabdus heinhorstiae]
MLSLANFAMKGPFQAGIAVVLLAALSVWFTPIGVLVGAIIALVTLRVSEVEGLKTLIWGLLVQLALVVSLTGSYWPAIVSALEFMLPVWLVSVVLKKTGSLALALQTAMVMVGLGVIGFHLVVANPTQWWTELFQQSLLPILQESGVSYSQDAMEGLIQMVTMLLGVFALTLWFSIVLLARWWQSRLYFPGRFSQDFYALSLPKSTAYIAVILAIFGLIGTGQGLVYDLSGVVIAGLMFQGLAIAHHTVKKRQASAAWLFALYVLLFLLPQTMLILATIGLIDTWMDFRNRWDQEQ